LYRLLHVAIAGVDAVFVRSGVAGMTGSMSVIFISFPCGIYRYFFDIAPAACSVHIMGLLWSIFRGQAVKAACVIVFGYFLLGGYGC